MRRAHVNRTNAHVPVYAAALESGNTHKQKEELKSWLGSIKELLDKRTLVEILAFIYTEVYPNEDIVKMLREDY